MLRRTFTEMDDNELVSMFMDVHTLARERAVGKARELLERQSVLLTTVLGRFAPGPFADALAVMEEFAEDVDDV